MKERKKKLLDETYSLVFSGDSYAADSVSGGDCGNGADGSTTLRFLPKLSLCLYASAASEICLNHLKKKKKKNFKICDTIRIPDM